MVDVFSSGLWSKYWEKKSQNEKEDIMAMYNDLDSPTTFGLKEDGPIKGTAFNTLHGGKLAPWADNAQTEYPQATSVMKAQQNVKVYSNGLINTLFNAKFDIENNGSLTVFRYESNSTNRIILAVFKEWSSVQYV